MRPSNSYVMAYLKPPWFTARVRSRKAMALGIGGRRTPVTTTRRESGWVRNVPDDADHPVFALTAGTP